MKNFINSFFETVLQSSESFAGFFVRESLQYKMIRIGGLDPKKVRIGFKNLERRKLIKIKNDNVAFTNRGFQWLEKSKFSKLRIKKQKWDKKWRIVIFDIPEDFRKQRNTFRFKLKSLGFYLLQESVFVYPFPCEEELGFLASYLNITDYIDIMVAESIGFKEKEIKEFFGL